MESQSSTETMPVSHTNAPSKPVTESQGSFPSVEQHFRDTVALLKKTWVKLFLAQLAILVLSLVGIGMIISIASGASVLEVMTQLTTGNFVTSMFSAGDTFEASWILQYAGISILLGLLSLQVMIGLVRYVDKPEASFMSALRLDLAVFVKYLIISLITIFLALGTVVFLGIPTIYISLLLSMVLFVVVLEKHSIFGTLTQSARMVRYSFSNVFLHMLVVFGLAILMSILLSPIAGMVSADNLVEVALYMAFTSLLEIVQSIVMLVYSYVLYTYAKAAVPAEYAYSMKKWYILATFGFIVAVGVVFALVAAGAFMFNPANY